MNIEIATRDNGGLDFILQQAKREGWQPGLQDTEVFSSIDPCGFFIGVVGEKIVGCISAVKFAGYGFVGYYIVLPEERRKGYGLQLFQHGMRYLGNINIGLDGVPEQVPNYKKSGFKSFHMHLRFSGVAPTQKSLPATHPSITLMTRANLKDLLNYDRRHFPASRDNWIRKWTDGSILGVHSLVYLDEGAVAGVGVIRPSVSGYRVGPWYANTPTIATALLQALLRCMDEGSSYFVDVPECNAIAMDLVQMLGMMQCGGGCQRMYTISEPVGIDWPEIYSVSSLEVG